MLRTFGVEKVSILGGGLAGWQRDDLLLEEGAGSRRKESLTPRLILKPW